MKLSTALRRLVIALLPLTLAIGSAFAGPSAARAVGMARPTAPAVVTLSASINGIAAISSTNAWLVGETTNSRVLLDHWNGKTWSQDKAITTKGSLLGISMVSATNGWAVGQTLPDLKLLVLHWNGKTWSKDTGAPDEEIYLTGMVTVGGDVWVSGILGSLGATVMLHRTGGRWYVVPMPVGNATVSSFAAISPDNIWAPGGGNINAGVPPRLFHWNGTVWKTVAFPSWASKLQMDVSGMAAGPNGTAWAVGGSTDGELALTMHWNGKAWLRGAVNIAGIGALEHVASIPGGTAWATGILNSGAYVIAHWNGKAWTAVKSLTIKNGGLLGIAATSTDNAWAVSPNLILHWNGKTWS